MNFSCIVGNPPYNKGNTQIYPLFYLWAKKNCDQVSMIFPSAWQDPKSGNGLKSMNTPEIKYDKQIVSIDNIVNGFKGVTGAKNTNIIYWKKGYNNGLDGKQLVYTDGKEPREEKFMISKDEMVRPEKIEELYKSIGDFVGVDTITTGRGPYALETDFFKDPLKYNMDDTLKTKRENSDDIKIYGCIDKIRTVRYVDLDYKLPTPRKGNQKGFWKVLLLKTWGGGDDGKYIGGSYSSIILAGPTDICTASFLETGKCEDFETAKKHAKYCISKFARALLRYNKFSILNAKSNWSSVPIQDYTEDFWNSDNIDDIDEGLFNKYNVPEDIRKFVRENIQPKTKDDILGYDGKD